MFTDAPGQPLGQNIDEKLFRLLVATVKDHAIFLINQNGHILSWNQGAEYIIGYKEKEIVGQHISVFYTPEDIQENVPRFNLNAALRNEMHESEGWRVRKDGSVFWANVVFTTLYNDDGHLIGFAKVTRDITGRKNADDEKAAINAELEKRVKANTAKIIANELRFRKLIENSYDGITLLDRKLNIFYRSISSERINGWSNSESLKHKVIDLIHPDDRAAINEMFTEVLANPNMPVLLTFRTRHKTGNYTWVECLFTNMLYDEAVNAIVCNFRDVTERKTAEEEIKRKTEQVENILESITDGFIALDNDFCYTYANKKIGVMLGCDPASLIGEYIWEQFPDAIESETHKAFLKAFTQQQYVCNEDYYAPLNLWQENHIYPTAGGLSVFIRDISERKNAELEIQLLNETLEKKVVDRTLQLEAVNKELESFSYSVSHDLRTPLRAISGYAHMLKEDFEGKLNEEGNRVINTIINNASLMGQLIDDLLSFSRLGRKEIVRHPVDMHILVKMCVAELLKNESKNYLVDIKQLPPCEADSSMLKQVWINLISNALKYSSKTDIPKIEIGFTKEQSGITYFVKDNGVGFDMKYGHKLFGVFQRLHRNDEFEGNGVGLALAKRIINKHSGELWAEAYPGKGATFYFSLPHSK